LNQFIKGKTVIINHFSSQSFHLPPQSTIEFRYKFAQFNHNAQCRFTVIHHNPLYLFTISTRNSLFNSILQFNSAMLPFTSVFERCFWNYYSPRKIIPKAR